MNHITTCEDRKIYLRKDPEGGRPGYILEFEGGHGIESIRVDADDLFRLINLVQEELSRA